VVEGVLGEVAFALEDLQRRLAHVPDRGRRAREVPASPVSTAGQNSKPITGLLA
jgi:hypothetical protein